MRQLWEMSAVRGLAVVAMAGALLGCSNTEDTNPLDVTITLSEEVVSKLNLAWQSRKLMASEQEPIFLIWDLSQLITDESHPGGKISIDSAWPLNFKDIYLNYEHGLYDKRTTFSPKLTLDLFEILDREGFLRLYKDDSGQRMVQFTNQNFLDEYRIVHEGSFNSKTVIAVPLFSYLEVPYVPESLFRDDTADACSRDRISKRQPLSYQLRIKSINKVGKTFFKGRDIIKIQECAYNPFSLYHGQPQPYDSRVIFGLR